MDTASRGGDPRQPADGLPTAAPVFLVSHRISTVKDANLILVLDQGRIVERGTHSQLIAHGGVYAELHQRQLLEEELAAV